MGKGDKKTKKGKIFMGSYGVTRPKKKKKSGEVKAKAKSEGGEAKKAPAKKAPVKKAAKK